jgi:hypothetical protein
MTAYRPNSEGDILGAVGCIYLSDNSREAGQTADFNSLVFI